MHGTRVAVSSTDIDTFHRDGVVHLHGVFEQRWLDLLVRGIETNLQHPSARLEARTQGESGARYCEDFWVWSSFPEFEEFVRYSPAGAIAGALMDAQRINLVMDNWFVREAGALSRAPWHHDIAYFDFEGTMCVLWVPLETTTRDEGIEFVRGSHLWDRLFMRVWFKDHRPAASAGWVSGRYYELPPDIDAERDQYDIVSFDLARGDCLVFDMRTLHGSSGDTVPKSTMRRYSLRMTAEDGHIRYRGDWAKNERAIIEQAGHQEGDSINSEFFPALWESTKTNKKR